MSKLVTIVFSVLFVGLLSVVIIQWLSTPKTAYIIIQEVYNGFEMKKEMEKKYLDVKNARDKILDSLSFELKMIADQIKQEQEKNKETISLFELKREEYFQRKQKFDEDNAALTQKYDSEILTQLNQYVKDYGEENKYTYIYGNDANGSLMYANEKNNVTKEVVEYINNKYEGN